MTGLEIGGQTGSDELADDPRGQEKYHRGRERRHNAVDLYAASPRDQHIVDVVGDAGERDAAKNQGAVPNDVALGEPGDHVPTFRLAAAEGRAQCDLGTIARNKASAICSPTYTFPRAFMCESGALKSGRYCPFS